MTDDYHPELAGYEPGDNRPVRHPMMARVTRIVVVIGILGLILPGLIISIATANNTANVACGLVIAQKAPGAVAYQPRFEVLGAEGPGWYCYAQEFDGTELLLQYLGLIPEVHRGPAPVDDGVPV